MVRERPRWLNEPAGRFCLKKIQWRVTLSVLGLLTSLWVAPSLGEESPVNPAPSPEDRPVFILLFPTSTIQPRPQANSYDPQRFQEIFSEVAGAGIPVRVVYVNSGMLNTNHGAASLVDQMAEKGDVKPGEYIAGLIVAANPQLKNPDRRGRFWVWFNRVLDRWTPLEILPSRTGASSVVHPFVQVSANGEEGFLTLVIEEMRRKGWLRDTLELFMHAPRFFATSSMLSQGRDLAARHMNTLGRMFRRVGVTRLKVWGARTTEISTKPPSEYPSWWNRAGRQTARTATLFYPLMAGLLGYFSVYIPNYEFISDWSTAIQTYTDFWNMLAVLGPPTVVTSAAALYNNHRFSEEFRKTGWMVFIKDGQPVGAMDLEKGTVERNPEGFLRRLSLELTERRPGGSAPILLPAPPNQCQALFAGA